MKKLFLIFLFFISIHQAVFSLEVIHPTSTNLVVAENSIFFSGKIDRKEKLFINDKMIFPARFGAFSHFVNLQNGENIFALTTIDSKGKIETIKYSIIKDSSLKTRYQNELIEKEPRYYVTTKNNVVLRKTPVDAGMNRLGYLPINTKIVITGVQNQYSRVYLTKDLYGWVKTSEIALVPLELIPATVEQDEHFSEFVYKPKELISYGKDKDKDSLYSVQVSENTPYSLTEWGNRIILSVYNLNKINETFTKEFVLPKFARYSLKMDNGKIDLEIKKPPFSKNNFSNKLVRVVIDAGHGGQEIGAVGCLGHKEKVLNLEVAQKLKRILEVNNFDVCMTRTTDEFVSLQQRVDYAKSVDAVIFISIHLNAVPISLNPNLNSGTVVFYYNPSAKPLAYELSNEISKELNTQNAGACQASFAVIRPTEYIGALVELAYLVNPKDVAVYKSKFFAYKSALGIYKGLVNYINNTL